MPGKTKQLRVKHARAKGTTVTLKATDTGDIPAGKSTHARSTSRRGTIPDEAAAGYRHDMRRKTVATEPVAAYRREERPKAPRNEAQQHQETRGKRGSPVQGRKKAPSELGITRRGGPRKRLPLHGG